MPGGGGTYAYSMIIQVMTDLLIDVRSVSVSSLITQMPIIATHTN